jgi:hypothetical protein
LFNKALLKAREAQAILVKPDFVSEDTWEKHGKRGMGALNERCERRSLLDHFDWYLFCSLKHLLKIGSLADWDEDDSNIEIGGIMDQVIEAHRSGVDLKRLE